MKKTRINLDDIYSLNRKNYEIFISKIDQSLKPRSPELLFDKLETFNISKETTILDLGCRDAYHACEMATRYGCNVIGVDIVESNITSATKRINENNLGNKVKVYQDDINNLQLESKSIDFIWCRDVLTHIKDLRKVFKSANRVLKPGGKMLIFHVLKTKLLSKNEAKELFPPLATFSKSMNPKVFEKSYKSSGFKTIDIDNISTEWRESYEEKGGNLSSKQLLRITRLRRNKEEYIKQFGEKRYASELANCHWGVYQMLGKLSPAIYIIGK